MKTIINGCIAVGIAVVFLMMALSDVGNSPTQQDRDLREQQKAQEQIGKEAENQALLAELEARRPERQALIETLLQKGVFREVRYRENAATVVVSSEFYALPFDDKQQFVLIIANEVYKDDRVIVRLSDYYTNKNAGYFSPATGLKLN